MTDETTNVPPPKKRKGCLIALGVGVGLMVLAAIINPEGVKPPAQAPSESATTAKSAGLAPIAVTSVELAKAYDGNEVAAQERFGGQRLRVTGRVTGITLDFRDRPVVQLEGVNPYLPVQASIEDKDAAARLSKGHTITVSCAKVSEVMSAPQLADCVVAPSTDRLHSGV